MNNCNICKDFIYGAGHFHNHKRICDDCNELVVEQTGVPPMKEPPVFDINEKAIGIDQDGNEFVLDLQPIRKSIEEAKDNISVLKALSQAKGTDGLTTSELCDMTGLKAPEMRNIIASLRKSGHRVVSIGHKYKFGTREETQTQIERLKRRAQNFIDSANGLENSLKNGVEHQVISEYE